MSKARNDDAPLSRSAAATRLGVHVADLPEGEWTKGRVRSAGTERPQWLRVARHEQQTRQAEATSLERADMVALLEGLGYRPDPHGSYQEVVLRADSAEMAVRPRWPHEGDRFDRHFDDVTASWWPALHDHEAEGGGRR